MNGPAPPRPRSHRPCNSSVSDVECGCLRSTRWHRDHARSVGAWWIGGRRDERADVGCSDPGDAASPALRRPGRESAGCLPESTGSSGLAGHRQVQLLLVGGKTLAVCPDHPPASSCARINGEDPLGDSRQSDLVAEERTVRANSANSGDVGSAIRLMAELFAAWLPLVDSGLLARRDRPREHTSLREETSSAFTTLLDTSQVRSTGRQLAVWWLCRWAARPWANGRTFVEQYHLSGVADRACKKACILTRCQPSSMEVGSFTRCQRRYAKGYGG